MSHRPPADLRTSSGGAWNVGLSANAYITRAVFGAAIPRGAPSRRREAMLAQLLGRSAAIRDALDNASRVAGAETADAMKRPAKS